MEISPVCTETRTTPSADGAAFMLDCDLCHRWFHGACVGVPQEEALKLIPEPKESKALTKWITKQMLPLVVPFVDGYMDLIFEGPRAL